MCVLYSTARPVGWSFWQRFEKNEEKGKPGQPAACLYASLISPGTRHWTKTARLTGTKNFFMQIKRRSPCATFLYFIWNICTQNCMLSNLVLYYYIKLKKMLYTAEMIRMSFSWQFNSIKSLRLCSHISIALTQIVE